MEHIICTFTKDMFPCFFMFHMHFHNKSPIYRNQSKPNLATTLSILTSEEKLNYKEVFIRVLRDSTPRFVGPSVRPSVTLYFFWVFAVFGLTAPAQMIW